MAFTSSRNDWLARIASDSAHVKRIARHIQFHSPDSFSCESPGQYHLREQVDPTLNQR